ncbi:MAG: trypsin-like peptidase domain-containing protein [Clostridia bacterium]
MENENIENEVFENKQNGEISAETKNICEENKAETKATKVKIVKKQKQLQSNEIPVNRKPPHGHPPHGHPPHGHPPQGHPPQGHPPQGRPPQGHPPQGRPPQGRPPYGFSQEFNKKFSNFQAPQDYERTQYAEQNVNYAIYPQANGQSNPQANYGTNIPPKQKKPKAFLVTISTVAILSVFSLIYVMLFSVYENQLIVSQPSSSDDSYSPSATPMPDYGDDESDEETSSGLAEGFVENPDIEIPDNIDELIISDTPTTQELDPEDVYSKVVAYTVTIEIQVETTTTGVYATGTGTGIIISSDGFILTNSHVIENSKDTIVKITDYLGNEYPAVVVAYDKSTDLAVLKTEDHNFTPAEFGNSDELEMGQWVMAVGNPGGSVYSGSVTRGIVSGLDREVGYSTDDTLRYIQTDAAINPGNSGGPLVNMYGQVIRINTSKIVSDSYEGMCFAIPINDAIEIVNQLLTDGYVSGRVRLGISASETVYGLQIYSIDEVSSFAGTEVAAGDIIVSVNGQTISELDDLTAEFLSYSPGDQVTVKLMRASENSTETYEVTITLLADEGETQQ